MITITHVFIDREKQSLQIREVDSGGVERPVYVREGNEVSAFLDTLAAALAEFQEANPGR